MNPFEVFLTTPILNLLVALYKALNAIYLPGALGFAIILLTVIIRMILWPLTTSQLKSSQKMAALKPHLDRIKAEHGHDKTRHQQEVNKLYKEHGVNPLAGCLPLLLQIPVFIALYNVLLKIVQVNGDFLANINQRLYSPFLYLENVPDVSFFGFPVCLSLYWNTFTVIGIIQQYKISGPGGLAKYIPKKWRSKLNIKY